jgi:hypothetical protein
MIKITKVKAFDDFKLECTFENGEKVLYDMSYILNKSTPMLDPLKNKKYFKSVFLESGAPVWKNGYDLCPNAIWQRTH